MDLENASDTELEDRLWELYALDNIDDAAWAEIFAISDVQKLRETDAARLRHMKDGVVETITREEKHAQVKRVLPGGLPESNRDRH